jgi:NAD(P)-dependent dehydrogenase (short-subunit alcohol dehydrogenase family)
MDLRTIDDIFGLTGRLAIVTGGASGIGLGIARMLADAGAKVVIADKDEGTGRQAVADIGGLSTFSALDVSSEETVVATFAGIFVSHGTPWLLVNCAGVQNRVLLGDGASADWDRNYEVNLRGTFLCLREASNRMIADQVQGRIVNISSLSSVVPNMKGLSAYAASKAGVNGLTRNAALELAEHGITVNAVLPGGVITPGGMAATGSIPLGRATEVPMLGMCTPDDIAGAVLYLASPNAGKISGQALAVDGGFLLG